MSRQRYSPPSRRERSTTSSLSQSTTRAIKALLRMRSKSSPRIEANDMTMPFLGSNRRHSFPRACYCTAAYQCTRHFLPADLIVGRRQDRGRAFLGSLFFEAMEEHVLSRKLHILG